MVSTCEHVPEVKRQAQLLDWTNAKRRWSQVGCMEWEGFSDHVLAIEHDAIQNQWSMYVPNHGKGNLGDNETNQF